MSEDQALPPVLLNHDGEFVRALKWSDSAPTAPGWYWLGWTYPWKEAPHCVFVHWDSEREHLMTKTTGPAYPLAKFKNNKWAGPIPTPID